MMFRKFITIISCVFALFASVGHQAHAASFSHEKSDLSPDPKAIYGTLPNGIRYVFYPNSEPKGRLLAYLRVAVGSAYETDQQQGIAHYIEHMAFNGSANFKPGELVKYFQSIGMSFGGDVNAFTGIDQTVFSLDLPNTEKKTIEKAFLLLGDYGRRLSLLASELDQERGVILAEMGDRDSVRWRSHKAQYRFLFDDAHLSRRMPIGQESTVSNMKKPIFDDFYNTWYRPERMTLIVVGDMTFEALLPQIEEAFSGLNSDSPAKETPDFGEFDHEGPKAFNYADNEAKNTQVEIGVTVREDQPADTAELRRHEAARDIAEGMLNRRLQKMAKQEGSVFISGGAFSYNAYNWSRRAGLRLTGNAENWQAMLEVAERALREALTYGFSTDEIKEAKARHIRGLDEAVLKASTRSSSSIARTILNTIGSDMIFMSPQSNCDLLKEYVANLDNETILTAFRKAWQADHRLLMVSGNAKAEESAILAAYGASTKVAVSPPKERPQIEFAYANTPDTKGEITEKIHLKELSVDQVTFANGLRLNLKKTDFKKNEIQIKLRFGSGTSSMPLKKEGLNHLANMIMIEGGLGKHSHEDIKSLLAGRSVRLGFNTHGNHMAFVGSTIPDDLELTLQFLRAYLTDAGYRPEAMRLARRRYAENHKGMERTPDGIRRLKVERLLAGGDIRIGYPGLTAFNKRTADEVRDWVDAQRVSTPLEISIVGDIDIEKSTELVARYFGSLPAANGKAPKIKPVQLIDPGNHALTVQTKIDRGQLLLYWKTTDAFHDIQRTRRMTILGRVFSEYLREEVREKIGGAYSPWAYSSMNDTYEGYGYLMSMVKIDPSMTERIKDAVLSIARKLHSEGTTEELFNRIILPVRSKNKKHIRTNGYWMNVISGSLFRPVQLEWAKSLIDDYDNMTTDEVNAYAKSYLDPSRAVVVTIHPEEKPVKE